MTHTTPNLDRVCDGRLSSFDQSAVEGVLRNVSATCGQLPLQAIVSWGGQVGQVRRANIELRSALVRKVSGNFAALVWVSSTPGGAPDGTQVLTVATGTLVRELETGRSLIVQTDASGCVAIDVEGLAGDRWIGVVPLGGVFGAEADWA